MIRGRGDAEALDRALGSPTPPDRPVDLAELARLGGRLEVTYAIDPEIEAAAYGRRVALAEFRTAAARGRSSLRRPLVRWLAVPAVVVLVVATAAVAVPAVERSLPGDPAYSVKLQLERARHLLASGDSAEASLHLDQAEARVEEAVRAQSAGRPATLPQILEGYVDAVRAFQQRASRTEGPRETDLRARAGREFRTHQEVLTGLLDVVPAAARPGIQRAINASRGAGAPEGVGPPRDLPPRMGPPEGVGPPDGVGPPPRHAR